MKRAFALVFLIACSSPPSKTPVKPVEPDIVQIGKPERAAEVEVTGTDENGTPQTWHVRGWPARILQHEVDHLDGTGYVDRMITRSFANADQAKELYGGKPIAEVRRLLGLTP